MSIYVVPGSAAIVAHSEDQLELEDLPNLDLTLVRCNSKDQAVLIMKFFCFEFQLAGHSIVHEIYSRSSSKEGPGVGSCRMEPQIIDALGYEQENDLLLPVSWERSE